MFGANVGAKTLKCSLFFLPNLVQKLGSPSFLQAILRSFKTSPLDYLNGATYWNGAAQIRGWVWRFCWIGNFLPRLVARSCFCVLFCQSVISGVSPSLQAWSLSPCLCTQTRTDTFSSQPLAGIPRCQQCCMTLWHLFPSLGHTIDNRSCCFKGISRFFCHCSKMS